jgi:hypothetical protein
MFLFNNLVYFKKESNNNSTSHRFITTLIVKQKYSFTTFFCGHVGEIKPIRKIGGKMEGEWMYCISGPQVKVINGVNTVYCDPSMKGSTCAIA